MSVRHQLHTRALHRDVTLTELGLGAAQFGNLNRETTLEASIEAVEEAWARGIRYFDTAPHYGLGLSEQRLGAALQRYPRDQFVVSTKVGRLLVPTPENAAELDDGGFLTPAVYRREWNFSRDGIRRSIDESLTRLGLDSIDIAFLHDPDDHWQAASTTGADTLIELRDEGVVRAIGAGMNQTAMLVDFARQCDIDVVMLAGRYTLLEQSGVDELFAIAESRGIGIVAAAIYNSGLLSQPVVPENAHYNYAPAPPELLARARDIAEVCARWGVALPDAAVQFPLRNPLISSVVVGTRTAEQVVSSVDRYATAIPDGLWDELREAGLTR